MCSVHIQIIFDKNNKSLRIFIAHFDYMILSLKEQFMKLALAEAKQAYGKQETPVGAVIVYNDIVIARAHNMVEALHDPTAHAEMLAITAAANYMGGKYLTGCTIFVTLEPCAMCAAAIGLSKASALIYGARDEKMGYTLVRGILLHPKTSVEKGIMEDECKQLLIDFFRSKRIKT
jgi:tRNA(adenine34) deaminase